MARERSTAEPIIGTLREAEVVLAQGDPVAKGASLSCGSNGASP